jgi:hypothetical protein
MGHNGGMGLNARLQSAAVYCVCFLFAAVFFRTVLPKSADLAILIYPTSAVSHLIWSIIFIAFAVSFIIAMRGYGVLAEKYQAPALSRLSQIYPICTGLFFIGIFITSFLYAYGADAALESISHTIVGIFTIIYFIFPLLITLALFPLRRQLPAVRYPICVAALWVLYVICWFIGLILGKDPETFPVLWVWNPILDSLFVAASGWLFWKASRS